MTDRSVNLELMRELVRSANLTEFVRRARELEPPDLADVLDSLDDDERLAVVRVLPPDISGPALVEMPDETRAEETFAALDPAVAADIVEELEDDEAADILGALDPEEQQRILTAVEDRSEVERLLRYDEETAGGLMTTRLVVVPEAATAEEALEQIRNQTEEVEDFYQVFVVDSAGRLVGVLPLRDLVVSPLQRPVREFMEGADLRVTPELDQEEVARLMARYNLPSVPVVDATGRLLGRVTFDDVADVVEAEATEDLLQFSGGSADEDIAAGWHVAVRSRLPWLLVNLLTAFLAGGVVLFFQDTLMRMTVLAAIMPIIAGMGGNAGTQALAVTVRRLALGLVPRGRSLQVIGKEMVVGLVNGLAIGTVVAVVSGALGYTAMLGLVVFLAMVGNLFVAGFAGAFIPILLERLNIDPAVASSIFVTTFTDVCGFLLLLQLADRLIL